MVGGGFGGLATTQALRRANVDITVVDRCNHHLFQPLLYQVATASLSPSDIAEPIRSVLRGQDNAKVRLAEVLSVDPARKVVHLRDDDGTEDEVGYDKLVLAAGASHSYFGNDEWATHAPGLKTLGDALEIRRRILEAFERAEWAETDEDRRAHSTFVVIGGGPTGVELAGAIAEIAFWTLRKDFRNVDLSKARVVLLEGGPGLLTTYPPELQERARKQVERLGVEVRLNARVTNVDEDGVWIGEEHLRAATVLWAAGVKGEPVAQTLGTELDRAGRVKVLPDCSIEGHPDTFVVGDLAVYTHTPDGKPVPGVCQGAMQMGWYVARCIEDDLAGRPRGTFRFQDKGSMATIGRTKAIADLGFLRVGGLVAWLLWVFVHVLFLVTFRNRVVVMVKWAWAWVTYERASRLIWRPTEHTR
ncbi:MAG: NAD(P)/FAD-dependent oxidoreductase [Alphaproteobacteria bacterium]|nr:NAD(P)/FAD-dependent oxidoreductase [Alphaproteobacteria bacterium]MCB9699816.1 NAD(P)/FAD-dependent oxidoreductase [Alphaproteobacteria bacterium]